MPWKVEVYSTAFKGGKKGYYASDTQHFEVDPEKLKVVVYNFKGDVGKTLSPVVDNSLT